MLRIRSLSPITLAIFAALLSAQEISVHTDTEIPVELHTKLDSHSARAGAKIEFHSTEAVLIGHNIVVPQNATILGHVVKVLDGESTSPNSLVRITINSLKWKHGEAPLNAVIISVEQTPAQSMLLARGHRFRDSPSFLKDVHIRAHLAREASTEFYSKRQSFIVGKGLCFVLRQVDPDHEPKMAGSDNILDIGPED